MASTTSLILTSINSFDWTIMDRRNTLKLIGSVAGVSLFGATTATANEPWAREETKRFLTHAEVQDLLGNFERRARVPFETKVIGESLEGRELTVAKVGSGDTDVFFASEQHGNEPTGTEALLRVLRRLSAGHDILDELTIHGLPMVNPDGAMRNQRENARPDDYCYEDPFFGEQCGPADPNRQHYFELPEEILPGPKPDENPSPETQAMLDYVLDLDPLWVADLHTQGGMYYDEEEVPGDMLHASNFWPIADEADPDAVEISQRLNVAMYDEVDGFGNAQLSVYPGGDTVNIGRNAYATYGYGSILCEMTGQLDDRGEAMEGQLTRIMAAECETILEETADGSLYDRDPARVDEIPDRPFDAGDWPWEETE